MYKSIYVPLDNSKHAARATELAVTLAKKLEPQPKLIGSHVYAAKMHEYRFKQMEYSLPEKYLEEKELKKQRRIHDTLISLGLKLISESYLEVMTKQCEAESLNFEPRMMDGKHFVEILKDVRASDCDLVIMGALGLGRGKDSQLGSVCARVAHDIDRDVWVVKQIPENGNLQSETILVGVDGSPESFGALKQAIGLAKLLDKKIECIAVFDPYLHYSVFNGLVGILTKKAERVFNFEEQNQLHEEIIDNGLAQIYQSHLNVAESMAAEDEVETVKTLLAGKAFQKILDHVRETTPWLLVIGRVGVHRLEGETCLGSNTDNLLQLCPCDILLTTGLVSPKIEVKAAESIKWTEEAQERMARVPDVVKTVASTAIVRLALEKGHTVITNNLVDEAMYRYMPKQAREKTLNLAQALAYDRIREQPVSICLKCGVAASEPNPVRCGVCGENDFELITAEVIEEIARAEGGIEEEKTYDGRTLKWSVEARRAIETVEDEEQRRRVKGRIEKSARGKKVTVITTAFCRDAIEEETGKPLSLPEASSAETPEDAVADETPSNQELPVVRQDANGVALRSSYSWTEKAIARILRVPAGFMRDRTQDYVEDYAAEQGVAEIDLPQVKGGLEIGRKKMEEMLGHAKAQA
ncbi:MAG: universal stress protein, partial [Candidatus Hydrogenedentes bacterium]|nr:universal stress protein [Candidatus Hydrogenedentota bacterium]